MNDAKDNRSFSIITEKSTPKTGSNRLRKAALAAPIAEIPQFIDLYAT